LTGGWYQELGDRRKEEGGFTAPDETRDILEISMRLVSLLVVVLAFGGASAGPVRAADALRLVVSVTCPSGQPEVHVRQIDQDVHSRPVLTRVARSQRPERRVRLALIDRSTFQRPPPATLRTV